LHDVPVVSFILTEFEIDKMPMSFRFASGWFALLALVNGMSFAAATPDLDAPVRQAMEKLVPGLTPDSIRPAPMEGLYEVLYGPRVFYVSADGRYLIQGNLIDLRTQENLTEKTSSKARLDALAKVGEEHMVIFAPPAAIQSKHTITVFTDIDCGYCRKLHSEIEGYNKLGVRVRYLFFPRAGMGSPSYEKAVSVWCADDRNKAMTEAKQGKPIDNRQCENPVGQHLMLGEMMGVNGTPALVLEDGELLPGYVSPDRLVAYIEAKRQPVAKAAQ
jgi:thiol:disulfide interchange protein DsbC